MEVFRTPDERFEGLPGFAYEPHYVEVGGLRIAYYDVGEGPVVVLLHGEPTWSFIYRKVIARLADAGFRCIAVDQPGFGRSDKPIDPAWYGAGRMVAAFTSVLDELELRGATLVVHDWGGMVGLHAALERAERVGRIVILDTALDPKEGWMNESWVRFREFVERTEELPIGEMIRATCANEPAPEVIAAYDAPYPNVAGAQGGPRGVPLSIARATETAPEVSRTYERLRLDPRPVLMIWAELDNFLTLATGERLASAIGRRIDHVIPNAGHGLPEDAGEEVGGLIVDWLAAQGPEN